MPVDYHKFHSPFFHLRMAISTTANMHETSSVSEKWADDQVEKSVHGDKPAAVSQLIPSGQGFLLHS